MSKYFAVRHEKIGFVISYFIPIAWVIMLWDSKRIRKGVLVYAVIELSLILIGMIGDPIGFILYWIAVVGFAGLWWKYHFNCVDILKSKNNSLVNQ